MSVGMSKSDNSQAAHGVHILPVKHILALSNAILKSLLVCVCVCVCFRGSGAIEGIMCPW